MLDSNLDGNTVILLGMLQQNYKHQSNLSEYVQKNIRKSWCEAHEEVGNFGKATLKSNDDLETPEDFPNNVNTCR